ncbi:hypothetical protein NA56DRAFT_493638 [Hyaloscypha hepaticicola]|uniref:Uncharacterized protein n=1 Tax=Hyaloscypha hepaticicola TaxID=2082293 RepID=A0A2J6QED7_9HELO|nr:hypothetical protein NA56DRAFT_493638 [Hyaloscypha hepaticicola]
MLILGTDNLREVSGVLAIYSFLLIIGDIAVVSSFLQTSFSYGIQICFIPDSDLYFRLHQAHFKVLSLQCTLCPIFTCSRSKLSVGIRSLLWRLSNPAMTSFSCPCSSSSFSRPWDLRFLP